ncbi:MAG TPA: ATP-binding protein [Pyrinomonadaceae bacterium]|nr:ATP-binding protein [Pyrinomonadaceae bacterium]
MLKQDRDRRRRGLQVYWLELNLIEFSATRRTESGTHAALETLHQLLEAGRDSTIVVNSSRRIVAANTAASDAFVRQLGTIQNRLLSEIIRDLPLHEAFTLALDQKHSSDVKIDFIGNEKRSYDVHVSPIELGGAAHAIGVFYDVTQVERLERIRQEFLSNISHELRTPLTSIIAFVETLEDGAIDDRENNRRFLSTIRRNAERMHGLISDILELSLIESGNVSIQTKPVQLHNLVNEVFLSLSSKAAERDIVLTNEVSEEARAVADPVRLEQMLTNLIDNAIKFNRPAGNVTVSASESSDKTAITVSDTGEGIMPEHLTRVFERFYRVDRGRTREVGGTGLGLAIVKHLSRLHGGEVSVESVPGRGTAFTVELPA